MSSLFVKICTFTLAPHPNAERLNLAYPTGTEWQCCVGKELVEGELGVYIPIDSLLSPELATTLGLPSAKDDKKYRIKTIKLRGVVSQGLLVGLQSLIDKGLVPADALEPLVEDEEAVFGSLRAWQEGDDLAEALSITRPRGPPARRVRQVYRHREREELRAPARGGRRGGGDREGPRGQFSSRVDRKCQREYFPI